MAKIPNEWCPLLGIHTVEDMSSLKINDFFDLARLLH